MLSLSNVGSRQAQNYYAADDYYTEGKPTGFWYGKGSQALHLNGVVEPEILHNLLEGKLPNSDLIHKGGGERRAATDLTFSAPKSISIQATVGKDERLLHAQEKAVKAALDYAESFIAARMTNDKRTVCEKTNNGVFAVIRHDTSRSGDPNIHHHCLLLNCTLRSDNKWRAFENRALFEQKTVLDAVYKAALRQECEGLGYEIKKTANGFELAHISREQILHFSQRIQAIDQGLEERGLSRESANAKERQIVTLESRAVKKYYDRQELQLEWEERGKKIGFEAQIPNTSIPSLKLRHQAIKAEVELALNHLSEREASFSKNQVLVEVLRNGGGKIEVGQIERVLTEKQKNGEIVLSYDGKKIATEKSLIYEKRILKVERAGRLQVKPICAENAWSKDYQLNTEQFKAVTMVLASQNQVVGIQGYAGTGKTTMLKPLVEISKRKGYQIVGVAPLHSAVKALRESGIEAQTLQSWIADRGARDNLGVKSIILLDEAGLVSAKQMSIVLERAAYKGARVVLVGDGKQYQGVEAGSPFTQLQKAGMEVATVKKMLRQKEPHLAEAANLSIKDPVAALQKLEVVEIKEASIRYQQIAKDFATLNKEERQESLILCGTHEARNSINKAIRSELKLEGKGQSYTIFKAKDLTAAQKRQLSNYAVGEVIRFERDYKSLGFKKGDYYKIKGKNDAYLILEKDGKKLKEFSPIRLSEKGFTVGQVEKREMAVGEWVRFTTTQKHHGYTNNERGWVEKANGQSLVLKTEDGRKLTLDSKNILPIDYAYASTGHSVQGLGAKRVFMEKESKSITTNQRSFYTDLTRAKEEVRVYTNDKAALSLAINRQVEKSVALEVLPKQRSYERA